MASRILSLLEILASRGAIVKTTTAPNAWAVVAQWRRYFAMKGEAAEEEENVEEFKRAFETQLEIHSPELAESILSPIQDPGVVEARKYFAMEYLRNLTQESSTFDGARAAAPTQEQTARVDRNAQAERILRNPDLRVPAGDEFMYLPQ